MTGVTITTGARLHFGPLSVAAPAGGKFGGVGVMIDAPRVSLIARIAESDSVNADVSVKERVQSFLQQSRVVAGKPPLPTCHIHVTESIPSHRGFGSGTQLGLAVAHAVSQLANENNASLEILARRVGRGLRSAIGLHGFAHGGFLVDGGRVDSNRLGTLVTRIAFPAEWRFVIAAPNASIGLSGDAEQAAFGRQSPMPVSLTAELCRITLMEWLPSVLEADFERCGKSMFEFGHAVGDFFSAAQGGVFAHRRMAEWAMLIQRRGVPGVAQTSWGPTLAVLCRDQQMAQQIENDFSADSAWSDCNFTVVSPLNRGATIVRE